MIMTAIVSPSARPKTSMEALMTPDRPYGRTAVRTTSQRVGPSASAASMWSRGVWVKTSRDIAITIGKIMMARTTDATNTDPLGSTLLLNNGIQPIALINHWAAGDRNGPRTINPQRPKMIEGPAASKSTTNEIGAAARLCRYWVRHSATPTAIGTAIAIARIEERTGVQSSPKMPNRSSLPATVQFRDVKKSSWFACKLGSARANRKMPTKSTIKTMTKPVVLANARNARSPVLLILASFTPRGARSTWPSLDGAGAWRVTRGTGECRVTGLWSTTGDTLGSCAAGGSDSTRSVAFVSVTDMGLPAR